MTVLFSSPWPLLAVSCGAVVVGIVAASGWSPRRRRTTGETVDFTNQGWL